MKEKDRISEYQNVRGQKKKNRITRYNMEEQDRKSE